MDDRIDIADDESYWDDGVEDGDSSDAVLQDEVRLGVYAEELYDIGIAYHDLPEVIMSGGMRDTIILLRDFFQPETLINFLHSTPNEIIDKFSAIVYSDEIPEEDFIHEVIELFHREMFTVTYLDLVVYYSDLFYSTSKFTLTMKSYLHILRNSTQLSVGSIATEEELNKYSEMIMEHREHVKFIVNQILDKSDWDFNKQLVLELLEHHDKDLFVEDTLKYLAMDKALFGGEYHVFKKHPAVDKFYTHKLSSPHHAEFYLMNDISLDSHFSKYLNHLPSIFADVYVPGMNLSEYKHTCGEIAKFLSSEEDFIEQIATLLTLVTELPPNSTRK